MDAEPRSRRWRARLSTVRVRTTATAVIVVGVALAAGAAGLVSSLRRSLTDDLRTALEVRAADVAAALRAGVAPSSLAIGGDEDSLVQVIDGEGAVVASSPNLAGKPRVAALAAGRSATVGDVGFDDDAYLVVAAAAGSNVTVLAGRALDTVEEATGFVRRMVVFGVPLLLLVVGATTWRLAGRAMAPVEAIRAEVDAISAAALHRRVPDPPGRDEIERLAVTMNRMLQRLQDAQSRERRLVSDASHELRSPIAAIRQHAEVALRHPQSADARELASGVHEEALRLQRIVEDLLFLARADEHGLQPAAEPVDLDDLVLEDAARLRATTRLLIDTAAVSAGRVAGDSAHLRRLIRNLTDNAARHARGTVALSVAEAGGDGVVLGVEDDGPGIPEPDRRRVFERFVRLDEARAREAGGSGLGLAIADEIARAHGGDVTIRDGMLGGARVEVRLPRLNA